MTQQTEHNADARLDFEPLVSVLFARADSVYKSLPGVDVWDADRDALTWPGGTPVVAHPPCRAWGSFAHLAKPRTGERDLALWAICQVRTCGGVLEHPKGSRLWAECGLPNPGEAPDEYGGWSLGVTQHWWGHLAEKGTKLYVCGCSPTQVPPIQLHLGDAARYIARPRYWPEGDPRRKPECTHAQREHTPPDFALWLVDLARRCSFGR